MQGYGLQFLIVWLLPALVGGLALAADKPPLNAVVVMDSSGSMKKTDPKELRKPAAKLFINLLEDRDQLSVMSFSDNAYPITFLTRLDTERNRQRSMDATDKVSSRGVYTNLYAAIERSIEILQQHDTGQGESIIILMSDGKMDVGDPERSAKLEKRILSELIPILQKNSIKIYSIAFTEHSDQALLQELAAETNGRYALAASDDALHKVFARIFEQNKEPNMLPLTENSFVVDPSIREITILANKKSADSRIYLQNPAGDRLDSTFKSDRVKWFVSSSFDMITLTRPAEGTWKILFSDDDNRAYIVADIRLRSEFEYHTEPTQPELVIRAWFEKDDQVITHSDLVSNIELSMEIEHPDGQLDQMDMGKANDDGVFIARFQPTMNGIYAATLVARSKTFQRQQVFSFRAVMPDPVMLEPEVEPEPPLPEPEPEPEPAPAEPPPQPEPPEDDLTESLIIFLGVNLAVIFIGVNIFFLMKMRRRKQ